MPFDPAGEHIYNECVCVCIYVCVCVCVCMCIYKCVCIYMCECVCVCIYIYIYVYVCVCVCVYISGGPLSALTCCVNARLLSAIKKISPLIYSQSWVGSWSIVLGYFSADVYLAELHCRGRERVFELEARSP